ncbi:MAG: type II toxin-antitoxin system Phd/YefM family antitoxin [Planctomycetota bacterium]
MLHISSSELKKQLGSYLAEAEREPIQIEKSGRPVAIMLSPSEYQHLKQMEDQYWIARADAARHSDQWVGHNAVFERLTDRLREAE